MAGPARLRLAAASALFCGMLVLAAMELQDGSVSSLALESDPFGDNAFWAKARADEKHNAHQREDANNAEGRGQMPHPDTYRAPPAEDPERNPHVTEEQRRGQEEEASASVEHEPEVVVIHGGIGEGDQHRDVVVRRADPLPERKPVVIRSADEDETPERRPVVVRSADEDETPERKPVVVRSVGDEQPAPDGTDMPLDSRVDMVEDRLDDLDRKVAHLHREQRELNHERHALSRAAQRQSRVAVQQRKTAEEEDKVAEHQRKVAETQANIAEIERRMAAHSDSGVAASNTDASPLPKAHSHVHVHVQHHHGVDVDVQAARGAKKPDARHH